MLINEQMHMYFTHMRAQRDAGQGSWRWEADLILTGCGWRPRETANSDSLWISVWPCCMLHIHICILKMHACVHAQSLSRVRLFATPWPVDCQPPLSMGFSWQEPWSGLPFPTPEDSQPRDWTHVLCLLSLLHWQAESLPLSHLEKP